MALALACLQGNESAAQSPQVSARAVLIPPTGPQETFEFVDPTGSASREIVVGGPGFSPEIELPRLPEWTFRHRGPAGNADDAQATAFTGSGTVVPPSGSDVWLVFSAQRSEQAEPTADAADVPEAGGDAPPDEASEPRDESTLSVHAIAADKDTLGDGGIVILNLAEIPIDASVGEQEFAVDPGNIAAFVPESESEGRLPVRFLFHQDGRTRPFVTTNWSIGEGRRRLAVVLQQDGSPTPKLTIVDEVSVKSE